MLTDNQVEALKLLHAWTRQTFDVWELAGPSLAPSRQKIMMRWLDKPIPRAKCGVTQMREAFYAAFGITEPSCGHAALDAFAAKAAEATGLTIRQ